MATTLPWSRPVLVGRVRQDLWRYISPAATVEQDILFAAGLLRLAPADVRLLGARQFLVSGEASAFVEALPRLIRSLATTSSADEEWSPDRVRGPIVWGRTLGLRAAAGVRHGYVTRPSRRAYQTPENELLVFLMDEVVRLSTAVGWRWPIGEGVGAEVSQRAAVVERWLGARSISQVERVPVTPRAVSRVRARRSRKRYQPVLAAHEIHERFVRMAERSEVRAAIEHSGLVALEDSLLFELHCFFDLLAALEAIGWRLGFLGLLAGSVSIKGVRGDEALDLFFQTTPRDLSKGSNYAKSQRLHGVPVGALRPDFVLRYHPQPGVTHWVLLEAKGGARPIEVLCRRAILDLLAYSAAYEPALDSSAKTHLVGLVWGEGMEPEAASPIMLASPDQIQTAVTHLLHA